MWVTHPLPTWPPCSFPQQPKSQPIGRPVTHRTSQPRLLFHRPISPSFPEADPQHAPCHSSPAAPCDPHTRNSSSAAPGHLCPMSQWAPNTSTETSQHRNKANAAPCRTSCFLPSDISFALFPWRIGHGQHSLRSAFLLGGSGAAPALQPLLSRTGFPFSHPLCWHQTPLSLLLWAEGAEEPCGPPGACLATCPQHRVPLITLRASRGAPKAIRSQGGIKRAQHRT